MKVQNFIYDGVFVHLRPGFAPYSAEFKQWTDDPGMVLCSCSDGSERRIPACCLVGFDTEQHPEPQWPPAKGIVVGPPSHS